MKCLKKICISKGWELQAPGYSGPVDLPNDYSITLPRSKDVPGAADNGFFPNGVGVYSKELMLSDISRHYILDIDGAYMCTTVALNGCDLVMHPHGYTPLLVDLTENAVFGGKNRLVITTDAKQPSTRWYSGAGIYRDVYLWDGGDIRIEPWDKFVYSPSLDTVKAEYAISADRTADVVLYAEIRDRETVIAAKECAVHTAAGQKTKVELTFDAEGLRVWNTESPFLYTMRAEIRENGSTIDIDDTRFGIRTLSVDAENGLLLNGKSIKLRGGCIHHDHGVLGAADYPAACRRKLMRLRDTGFNALRIAHNPPSLTLLELCDEMGIIVMDEAFDCWRQVKGGEWNYHKWFDAWWERDISYMVLRDRNHPCVFSYSIGNEIPESYGTADGDELSARLTAEIKKYDITRPITSATWQMGEAETWADRTEKYFAPLDMCGYNYIYRRYESDHERYPARVIWGSETHAIYFYDSWNSVLRNNHVIGDFTWTAYDNLGEAGTGRALWARDGRIDGISLATTRGDRVIRVILTSADTEDRSLISVKQSGLAVKNPEFLRPILSITAKNTRVRLGTGMMFWTPGHLMTVILASRCRVKFTQMPMKSYGTATDESSAAVFPKRQLPDSISLTKRVKLRLMLTRTAFCAVTPRFILSEHPLR